MIGFSDFFARTQTLFGGKNDPYHETHQISLHSQAVIWIFSV